MKRIISLVLIVLSLLSLCACADAQPLGRAMEWVKEKIEKDALFSFDYDGVPYSEHISKWEKTVDEDIDENGNTLFTLTYTRDNVKAWAEILVYCDIPAVDWVCYFENTGSENTKPVSNIQALNASYKVKDATVNYAIGSNADGHDFEPLSQNMAENNELVFESVGGRSSQGYMPYFDVCGKNKGIVVSIGWTGQWTAKITATEKEVNMVAGMSETDIALYPKESMRTPSVVIAFFDGDRYDGNQVYRNMLINHYLPKDEDGEPITILPYALNAWGSAGEKSLLARIAEADSVGLPYEILWVDAGWYGKKASVDTYDPAWFEQVGSWSMNSEIYPNGFKVISEKLSAKSKGLMLWFEPERVMRETELQKEHPEYIMPAPGTAMFNVYNFADDEATDYIIDLVSGIIKENGVTWYRQDFNCDPLARWQYVDAKSGEHRVGITEIKYITNLYRFLDSIRRECPGLMIDNCASGGRRLDIEMQKRSFPFWRSDYYVSGADVITNTDMVRNIGWNLNYWVPFSGGGSSSDGLDDNYEYRSQLGATMQLGIPKGDWWEEKLNEYFICREMMDGEYYILAQGTGEEYNTKNACYEYCDKEEEKGFLMAFCPVASSVYKETFNLRGLEKDAVYLVEITDTDESFTLTGKQLMEDGLNIDFKEAKQSRLIYITKQ